MIIYCNSGYEAISCGNVRLLHFIIILYKYLRSVQGEIIVDSVTSAVPKVSLQGHPHRRPNNSGLNIYTIKVIGISNLPGGYGFQLRI